MFRQLSILTILICTLASFKLHSQVPFPSDSISYYAALLKIPKNDQELIKRFYKARQSAYVWQAPGGRALIIMLDSLLYQAADHGLEAHNYPHQSAPHLPRTYGDLISAEISFTYSLLKFSRDLMIGDMPPSFAFQGLPAPDYEYDLFLLLNSLIRKNQLDSLPGKLGASLPEISIILDKIHFFRVQLSCAGFKDVKIMSLRDAGFRRTLIQRCYQLGLVADTITVADSTFISIIKKAHSCFGLGKKATFESAFIVALNVPLVERLRQLEIAVNYYRWLSCLKGSQQLILVNIPAAWLAVYNADSICLEMKMIVGKPATPTPTLTSIVNEVVLYPFWYVPQSIAINEMLPNFKQNPELLNLGNYQVLNKAGKIIDPDSIHWQQLNSSNFPYIIRQSTGCDNALGIVKFNFENPFSVYLHDSPTKMLFGWDQRFFSHGCMRLEKPLELGRLLLKDHPLALDTLDEKNNLSHPSPQIISADHPMPLVVWYCPVRVTASKEVVYYNDIYHRGFGKNGE